MRKLTIAATATLALTCGVALARNPGDFFIQGAKLTKQADGSWSGPGTLDGVKGKLTITGTVLLLKQEQHTIHWTWVAGTRRVAGCSVEQVLTRPHGIQLWDGSGRITKTSAKERKYQGRLIALYGPTQRSDLTHAQISIVQSKLPPHRCS